jgi:hypothetical protein
MRRSNKRSSGWRREERVRASPVRQGKAYLAKISTFATPRSYTLAMAAGLTDHVWTLQEVLMFRVPPWHNLKRYKALASIILVT